MSKRKGGKGLGELFGMVRTIVWVLFVMGLLLAAFQRTGIVSIDGAVEDAKNKASYYAQCIPANECGLVSIIEDIKNSPGSNNPMPMPSIPNDNNNNNNNNDNNNYVVKIPEKRGFEVDFSSVSLNRNIEGYRGPQEDEPYVNNAGLVNRDSALMVLNELTIKGKEKVDYDRSEWKHWTSIEGKSCWTSRNEILYRDAKPGTVLLMDKQRQPTDNYEEACAIGKPVEIDGRNRIDTNDSGVWIDPYSGETITSSSNIDIDHIIPLSNAAQSGGQKWDSRLKERFANDPDNLLATSASENRSKGDKGPGEYMPTNENYHCQYAKKYTMLSYKYGLTITSSDYNTLQKTLNECNN